MSSRFFTNAECEFFPCHGVESPDGFNCLFCFCPLYALGEDCPGAKSYDNPAGIKDCSRCLYPHDARNYDEIMRLSGEVIERYGKKRR